MPRADSKQHLGTQFYHSQFSNSPYLPESPSSSQHLSTNTSHSTPSSTPATSSAPKKKHVCSTCERAFTTSGHLARHSRVHTGERNHKCPFPGCETRCSRQDNLQQQLVFVLVDIAAIPYWSSVHERWLVIFKNLYSYRIHLSPGSRRSSARSAASKAMNGKKGNNIAPASTEALAPPPLSSPPPLEPARIYSHHSTPPDSPPPLTQATLPATASIPLANSRIQLPSPGRSSSSSSPDTAYPPSDHQLVSLQSQGLSNPPNYNYRSGTTTYQEQSQGPGYTYVHTTPITHPPSGSSNGNSFSSRHSISHISHPQSSYQSSSGSPSSPASSHSHYSGPPTPTYPAYHDDTQSYHHQQHSHHGSGMVNNDHHQQHPHSQSQSHILSQQNGNHYSYGRFDSPPLTLAPIQGERLIRRDDSRHSQNHNYIHAQSVNDYPYHQGMGLGHGAWKAESEMRKGLGAALVWTEDSSLFLLLFLLPSDVFLMDFLPSFDQAALFSCSFLVICHILRVITLLWSSIVAFSTAALTLLPLAPYLTLEALWFCLYSPPYCRCAWITTKINWTPTTN